MMDIRTIGFIGIGNMGRPMAANLVKGGYQVVAYDADATRAAQFAKDVGAKSAATLAELGKQRGRDRHHAADRQGGARLPARDRRRRARREPAEGRAGDRHELGRSGRHARDACGPRQARACVRRCAGVGRRAARDRRLARDHDRRRGGSGRGRQAGALENGHAAVRRRRTGQRPRHEGAEQLRGRHRLHRGRRGGAGGQALRARSERDDRRDERLDGQELQHRERREAAGDFRRVRLRLRARPAGEGREDRGRSGERDRRRQPPHPPLVRAVGRGARQRGRRKGPHARLYVLGEARQKGRRRVTPRARL